MIKYLFCLFMLFNYSAVYPADSDAQRYFNSGKASLNDGAYSMAINYFEKTISAEPNGELADDSSFYQ